MRKRILIVRLDAIGDYILFRNVLRFIRNSKKYCESEITIFGNPAWRDIAETFDADCADNWVWANNRNDLFRKSYENLLPYCVWHKRVRKVQSVWHEKLMGKFDEVLSPQAFHDPLLDEFVEKVSPCAINGWQLPQGESQFVFYRNCAIASSLTGEKCDVRLELKELESSKKKMIMFFTGGSHWTKRWPMRNWKRLEKLLPEGFSHSYPAMNGTLPDFFSAIAASAAVVTNDTMASHAAAALDVPCVVITNGSTGKDSFWPYPETMGKRHFTIAGTHYHLPPIMPKEASERFANYLTLSMTSPEEVASTLRHILHD